MRKLLAVLPLMLALGGGCDATRRDFTYCDQDYPSCGKVGYSCNFTTGLCEPDIDGGAPDTRGSDAWMSFDLSTGDAVLPVDAADAPVAIDAGSIDTGMIDTGIIDAPPIMDVSMPDTRVPDAAGSCSVDNDCFGVASGAYCVKAKCVACKTNSQCNNDAGVPFCSAQNTCVSCASVGGADGGSACPASAPVCAASGGCVECVQNNDCPTAGKAFCVRNQCVGCNVAGASASDPVSSGSADGGAIDSGARDAGAATGPCTGAAPVCATSGTIAGQCVGCVTSADCGGTTPICNTFVNASDPPVLTFPASPAYTCAACTSDTQCGGKGVGPGVCMFHQDPVNGGGRCATDAETIYVKNSTGCGTGATAGTVTTPFCNSQDAISAVSANKRLIVMSGSNLYPITSTSTSSAGQITIVGQNTATTAAGAFVGVRITAGNVYIRGLTVAGGNNTGIVVEAGATLRMNRCVVKGNAAGGLIVKSGANFDVANTVFAENQGGIDGVAQFAAAYLGGGAPTTGPSTFWYNTVVSNIGSTAVVCYDSQPIRAMLMHGNQSDFLNCVLDGTSAWESGTPRPAGSTSFITNPALDATYHLTSSSPSYSPSSPKPCRNFIAPTVAHPFDDMDGEIRPKDTRLDCGADEY